MHRDGFGFLRPTGTRRDVRTAEDRGMGCGDTVPKEARNMKYRNKNARVLSPKQVRAVALRAQGMSVAAIAREIGQHRVTVSRWFNQDELVIAELAGSVEDMYDEEVRRHVGIRHKAMGVVESALDAGDVRTALAVLRLSPPPPPSVAADPGWMDGLPVSGVVD